MNHPIRIATVELMPYPPEGEFVIVGVLAVTEEATLALKVLEREDFVRLHQFFPEIDPHVFETGLERIQASITEIEAHLKGDAEALFRALTVPREGMLRIRSRGAGITDDLEAWLDEAYARFVKRHAQPPLPAHQ